MGLGFENYRNIAHASLISMRGVYMPFVADRHDVGADKDSEKRQRAAIQAFAKRTEIQIVDEFYDAAVSGADPIDQRRGFTDMLKRIEGNGVRTIIVETANRFARDLMVQEVGYSILKERGIELIAADSPTSLDHTPTAKLIRQVLGAVAEFDKAMTVAKLRAARDWKRASTGRCEGRKSHAAINPNLVREAKPHSASLGPNEALRVQLGLCGAPQPDTLR
jgi:DNA invertase Pin-like site-specific DNA recombinase